MRSQRTKLSITAFTFSLAFLTFSPVLANSLSAPSDLEGAPTTTVGTTSTTSTTTTTTTTIPLTPEQIVELARAQYGPCGEYHDLAISIGWPEEEWPQLSKIMYRESRCLPEACSESDSGRVCRDWGLLQINEYSWRRTIVSQGYVMKDMWTPQHNLTFGLWLWKDYGWSPWKYPAT